MKLWKVQVIFDLGPSEFKYEKLKLVFLRNNWAIFNQLLYVNFQVRSKTKIHEHDAGHMTKMAATPIYCNSPSNIFFPEPLD